MSTILRVCVPVLLFAAPLVAGPWAPDVRLHGNDLVGSPAKQHIATHQAIEVVETEGCSATVQPPHTIRLSGPCAYLRGLYRYVFVPEEGGTRHQLLVEFSAVRQGAGHGLLLSEPIEISDDAATAASVSP